METEVYLGASFEQFIVQHPNSPARGWKPQEWTLTTDTFPSPTPQFPRKGMETKIWSSFDAHIHHGPTPQFPRKGMETVFFPPDIEITRLII